MFGLRDAVKSVQSGLDVEMPFRQQRAVALPAAVADGTLSVDVVDIAAVRVVATLLRFAPQIDTQPSLDVVAQPAHRELARRAAVRSAVLLRNDRRLLPVAIDAVERVAVLGRLAAMRNLGDGGSSDVRSSDVVTALDGIRAVFGTDRVVHDESDASIAADADLVVVVVGYTKDDEGEFIDDEGVGRLTGLFPPQRRSGRRRRRADGTDATDRSPASRVRRRRHRRTR